MGKFVRIVIACGAMLALLGCSTHYTTARPSGGATPIYMMSDAQALEIARRAAAGERLVPLGSRSAAVNGPFERGRGYHLP